MRRKPKAPKKRRIISIRWILSGAAVALTAFSVLGVGMLAERNARRALTRELQTRLLLEARNLALASSGALLTEFPELTLAPILSKMTEDGPEIVFAVVADLDGLVQGDADARKIGEKLQLPPTLVGVESIAGLAPNETVLADETLLVAAAPVSQRGGDQIGTAYVALERSYIERTIADARRNQLILVAILLALGSIMAVVLVSVLLRPVGALREGLERIGRGDLDTPLKLNDPTELGLLAETMNEMSTKLKAAQEEHVEKERLAREVELAREIQSSLIPSKDTRVGSCIIDGAHRAAAEVGGDYWDVFPLEDGRIGLVVADVSGKGLAGCLVTSMLAALIRAFRDTERSPTALLVKLEKNLQESLRPGTFITMFYGILDPYSGDLVFSSAGHSPLLIWRSAEGRADWFRTKGIPLGAVKGGALATTLQDERVQLGPGDLAVQYTDGLNEAFDITGRHQFGFKRIEETVKVSAALGSRGVIDSLLHEVKTWAGDQPPLDDETLLVVGRSDAPAQVTPAGRDPIAAVARGRAEGHQLTLRGDLDTLTEINGWLSSCRHLGELTAREKTLLESALYEVAANIAEHGLLADPAQTFELIWSPGSGRATVKDGVFLFVDEGSPFAPPEDSTVDFQQPDVRRRGRGLGLEIIHSAMRQVAYHPRTPAGNITTLVFDPAKVRSEQQEVSP